jgi:hypothetical protein
MEEFHDLRQDDRMKVTRDMVDKDLRGRYAA